MNLSQLHNQLFEREEHEWDDSKFQARIEHKIPHTNNVFSLVVSYHDADKYVIFERTRDELTGDDVKTMRETYLNGRNAVAYINTITRGMK